MQAFGGALAPASVVSLSPPGAMKGTPSGEAVGLVDGQFPPEAEVTLGVRLGGV